MLRGQAGEKLLDTYHEERAANAQNLLKTTDILFALQARHNRFVNFIRTTVFPPLAGSIIQVIGKRFFALISQIRINYRAQSLSQHGSDGNFKVKAGDRMPYFLLEGQSIYDRLRQPKFHVLAFSNVETGVKTGSRALQSEVELQYSALADFHCLSLSSQVKEIFGTDEPFTVLLRPDNYLALLAPGTSCTPIGLYFDTML